jgi:hypothetical protein
MAAPRGFPIHASEGQDGVTLATEGLGPIAGRELELVAVSPSAVADAVEFLAELAAVVARRRAPRAGEVIAFDLGVAHAVVRVVEPPSELGWPRAVRAPLPALRVVAPDAGARFDRPPNDAIATVILDRACRAFAEKSEEDAEQELERGIALFPGDPAHRDETPFDVPSFNRENYLSHFFLAVHRGRRSAACYAAALARSAEFAANEAGATRAELVRLDGSTLARLAQRVLSENLSASAVIDRAGPAVAVLVSPFWRAGEKGRVRRESALLPLASLSLYYSGAARRALEHPETPALTAAVVLAHQRAPDELLTRTWPARIAWLDPHAPSLTTSIAHEPGQALVSAVLGQIALLAAAGVERGDIRAALGLGADDAAAVRVEERLAELDRRIEAWQVEALA